MNTASLVAIIFIIKIFERNSVRKLPLPLPEKAGGSASFHVISSDFACFRARRHHWRSHQNIGSDRHFKHSMRCYLFIYYSIAFFYVHKQNQLTREEIKPNDAVLTGFGQAIGLLPGISCSGITASFGIANGITTEAAFLFFFHDVHTRQHRRCSFGIFELTRETNINYFGYAGGIRCQFPGNLFCGEVFL